MYSDNYNSKEVNQNYEETNNNINKGSSSKKMLWVVIAAIILVLIVILYLWLGRGDETNNPKPIEPQITISSQKVNVSLENSLPLKAIVTNIENAVIVWTSSNEAVAIVDNNGNVTGVSEGIAIITATYTHTDNNPYSVSCEVTVVKGDPNISLTNAKFPEGEVIISEGDEFQINVIFEPAEAYVANQKFTSTDSTIVTVDEKTGKIKAINEGEAKIRLNVNDGDFNDEIVVNVTKKTVKSQIFVPVSSIKFDKQLIKIVLGQSEELKYEILPTNALSSDLNWSSSDTSVATVDKGIVSALKVGTTEITVTSLDGEYATTTVEVTEKNIPVTGIEIFNNIKDDTNYIGKTKTFNLKVNGTAQILANVLPSNATNKEILYKSDKESVATVDEKGLITAKGQGTATITLTSKDNSSKTEKITVNVTTSGGNSGSNTGKMISGGVKELYQYSVLTINKETIKNSIKAANEGNYSEGAYTDVKINRCYVSSTTYLEVLEGKPADDACKFKSKGLTSESARVTAVLSNGISVYYDVKIKAGITLGTGESVKKGGSTTINVSVSDNFSFDTCESSDKTIATAEKNNNSCKITGVKEGTITLTVKGKYTDPDADVEKDISVTRRITVVKGDSESGGDNQTSGETGSTTKTCTPWSEPVVTNEEENLSEGSEDCVDCEKWVTSVQKWKYEYSYACENTEDATKAIDEKKISADGFSTDKEAATDLSAALIESEKWCNVNLKGDFSIIKSSTLSHYYEVTTRTRNCS